MEHYDGKGLDCSMGIDRAIQVTTNYNPLCFSFFFGISILEGIHDGRRQKILDTCL